MTFTCIRKSLLALAFALVHSYGKLILRISRACICLSLQALSEQLRLMITPQCNSNSNRNNNNNIAWLPAIMTICIAHYTFHTKPTLNSTPGRFSYYLYLLLFLKYLVKYEESEREQVYAVPARRYTIYGYHA